MTQPDMPSEDRPDLGPGTDVAVDPAELDGPVSPPATSNPEEMTPDDAGLGGVGGRSPGGAG